jgi:hypothetical protein
LAAGVLEVEDSPLGFGVLSDFVSDFFSDVVSDFFSAGLSEVIVVARLSFL